MLLPEQAIRVFSLCAGTDSPVAALKEIVGSDKVDHHVFIDISKTAQEFIMLNMAPKHLYRNVADGLKENLSVWSAIALVLPFTMSQTCG